MLSKQNRQEMEKVWQAIRNEEPDYRNLGKNGMSQRTIAFHEAGHAVISWTLGMKITKITIVPGYKQADEDAFNNGDYGFYFLGLVDVENELDHTLVLAVLAGMAAEVQLNGESSQGGGSVLRPGSDKATAAKIARKHFNIKNGSSKFLKYAKELVAIMVRNQWPLIEALANELLRVRVLEGEDAMDFLVRSHSRLVLEAHFPPEPIFDYLASLPSVWPSKD